MPGTRIADVRIADFSNGTAARLGRAIIALRSAGARAVVLDLRDNPGGLLAQAVAVASELLPGGNVLWEKDARGDVQPVPVRPEKHRLTLALAALVDGGTASAAEIVTGALQDDGRAVVVGEKTFGTGTVLNEFRRSDGSALMLAVCKWLTPDGRTIWHKRIERTVRVALGAAVEPILPKALARLSPAQLLASKDAQLLEALSLLRQVSAADAHRSARQRNTLQSGMLSGTGRCKQAQAAEPQERSFGRETSSGWVGL